MTTPRPSEHLKIGFPAASAAQNRSTSPTSSSPNDPSSAGTVRSPFGLSPGLVPSTKMSGTSRSGAGSPSLDMSGSGRLFANKRTREIQAQEGVPGLPVNPWGGPPTSGNSTPLRENIPESPTDEFPDFVQLPASDSLPQTRRARAGTVPSRFSPGGVGNGLVGIPALASKNSRQPPSQSSFSKTPSPGVEGMDGSNATGSTLLSRLRAGSMPQRSPFTQPIPGTSSPFGPSIFSSWAAAGTGRNRGSTLASIASIGSNGPSSPAQSQFSKEGTGETDVHMRTLDYLGLAETPQQPRAQLATPYHIPTLADLTKAANRFRSYSVNNKDKYADEEEEDYDEGDMALMAEYAQLRIQDELAATNAAIHNHNMAVRALANQGYAALTRPRARTTGVMDMHHARLPDQFAQASWQIAPSAEMHMPDEEEYGDLPQSMAGLSLARSSSGNNGLLSTDEQGLEGPTSALWLGSVPTSTTQSTLTEMFKKFGPVLSARVLTHKNCGFVNFERVESAINAKASLNGKELFPGGGPIRINFAKPASASNTPGHDGAFPSPSPEPFGNGKDNAQANVNGTGGVGGDGLGAVDPGSRSPKLPPLSEMTTDILHIVKSLGATDEDRHCISQSLEQAVQYTTFIDEIPPIKEPAHTRVHDAPKLRDIRKRIDNQSLSKQEIENIAVDMLPEIAELSSDYLGNTVVQKLFEHCSDALRDSMLAEIAPHMAEIGVHKNGTWAAQKIIEVCKTPHQMGLIVEHLRPYTVPLFLDQYGNYVLQGCLKFGSPYNDFIFQAMLSRMWVIAQGRYGARAMRACLESHHATKDQQRMLAGAITLHSVQLATNTNGALLLTWFLDTCTFPQRRTVLSPHLVPYLVHLCTHKVAYLTVLKVINQRGEADARDAILRALFFTSNHQVLDAILSDHACGATLIFKVLTTPFFDETIRSKVMENVKEVLIRIKAQPNQGYKRLMDEVGMSTRTGGGGGGPRDHGNNSTSERQRPGSRQTSNSHNHNQPQQPQQPQQPPQQQQPQQQQQPSAREKSQHQHQAQQAQQQQQQQQTPATPFTPATSANNPFFNPMNPGVNPAHYELGYGIPRSESVEPALSQPFPAFGSPAIFGAANPPMTPAMSIQNLQFQQRMMARGAPAAGMNGFYPSAMQAGAFGVGGFPNGANPALDAYRTSGSPIQPQASAAANGPMAGAAPAAPFSAPGGFGMGMGAGIGMAGGPGFGGAYGGASLGGMQNMGYMQQQQQEPRGPVGRSPHNSQRRRQ